MINIINQPLIDMYRDRVDVDQPSTCDTIHFGGYEHRNGSEELWSWLNHTRLYPLVISDSELENGP